MPHLLLHIGKTLPLLNEQARKRVPQKMEIASDREVNAPEETHFEVVRHVAAVRPTPRRRIDVRAMI